MLADELLEFFMTVAVTRDRLDLLVRENLDLVYAAALRQMRDPHIAADVTQAVFIVLQQKLPDLDERAAIGAWLLRVTRYACMDAAKRTRRRVFHEKKAAAMRSEEALDREDVSPLIDEALERLAEMDRELVILAFYQGMSHEQIAARLRIGREAAHKRVQRAVERLRKILTKRGMPAAGMAAGLAALGKPMATPAAVSQAVTAGLTGQAPPLVQLIAKGTMIMMKVMKMKTGLLVLAVAGVVLATVALVPAWGQAGGNPAAPASAAAPASMPNIQAANSTLFLPERTLTIFGHGATHDLIADLDTGTTLPPPSDTDLGSFGMLAWMERQGGDLLYEGDSAVQALMGVDMASCPAEGMYDEMEPQWIMLQLLPSTFATPAVMSVRTLPATFAFRTREGGVGILQVVKLDDPPSSVTIRYKMLTVTARNQAATECVLQNILPEMDKLAARLATATDPDELASLVRSLTHGLDAIKGTTTGLPTRRPGVWRPFETVIRIMTERIEDKQPEKVKDSLADLQRALDMAKTEVARMKGD